jgi:hypothetical protein
VKGEHYLITVPAQTGTGRPDQPVSLKQSLSKSIIFVCEIVKSRSKKCVICNKVGQQWTGQPEVKAAENLQAKSLKSFRQAERKLIILNG